MFDIREVQGRRVKRPIGRYHGGKWVLGKRIIKQFPPHKIYTEAFGGLASVLMQKARVYSEVYNDIDGRVVNLFRVLRCEECSWRLVRLIELTPAQHETLLRTIRELSGSVAISGYRCDMYDDLLSDWHRVDFDTYADSARGRVDSMWMNYESLPLFR